VDLIPLVSTGLGAAIALGGTIIADVVRSRDSRSRDNQAARKSAYLDLVIAHGVALQELREIATSGLAQGERVTAINARMTKSGIYLAREKLFMAAPRWVLRPAESAFEHLIRVRDVVRAGATLSAGAYHDVYHPYSEKMWLLRNAIRSDLDASQLTPSDLARVSWDNRDQCSDCASRAAATQADASAGNP
jgi:hypothetical protein